MIEFRDYEEAVSTKGKKYRFNVKLELLILFLENRCGIKALEGLSQRGEPWRRITAIILDGPVVILGRDVLLKKNEAWGKTWTIVMDGEDAQDFLAFVDPALYARVSRGKPLF